MDTGTEPELGSAPRGDVVLFTNFAQAIRAPLEQCMTIDSPLSTSEFVNCYAK